MIVRQLYTRSFLLIISLLLSSLIFGQDFSNKGTDFWVVYSGHIDALSSRMALYITSNVNTTGTVSVNGKSTNFSVTANQVTVVQLTTTSNPSNSDAYLTSSNLTQFEVIGVNKGIHVTSQNPVVVYSHILNSARSGSTLVLPTKVLGREYIVATYKSTGTVVASNNTAQKNTEFNIIATEDSTNVEITPTNSDYNKKHLANVTFDTLLNKGDVYQFQSFEDLTGTRIKAVATATSTCKKIAVYSGSTWTSMGCASASSGDNLYQQLFPTSSWGKHFFTSPSLNRSYDIFRILVQDTSAFVYVNGVALSKSGLTNNSFYEISTSGNNSYRDIYSEKPISVMQYFITMNCDNNTIGDPEMIALNPIEQTLNDITVMSARKDLTPPNTNISGHYLNIIYKTSAYNSLKIDGLKPISTPKIMGTTGYSYIQEDVTNSTNNISPSHRIVCDTGFICIAYGFGNVESYGYNAGANVVDLYQHLEVNNNYNTVYLPITCTGVTSKASITLPYKPLSLKWDIPNYPKDTVYNPMPEDSTFTNGKMVYKYSYKNQFNYKTPGQYLIDVIANNPTSDGCSGEQDLSFYLTVSAPPKTKDSIFSTHCLSDSVSLIDKTTVTLDERPIIKYMWDFGTGVFKDTTANIKFKADTAGRFNIRHFVINDIGCLSDTLTADSSILQLVLIDSVPKIKFSISDTTCLNTNLILRDSTLSTPHSTLLHWVWNYGDGSPLDSVNDNQPKSHAYTQLQSYRPILSLETLNGCHISDSISFTNRPFPVVGFTIPDGCLSNALAAFSDTSSIVDNTGNFKYLWNFNDPSATTANPNASTLMMPTHKFSSAGNYDIILQVASQYGCVAIDTNKFTVTGAIPHPSFKVLNDQKLCTNQDVTIQNISTIDFGNIEKLVIYWDNDNGATDSTVDTSPTFNKTYSYRYMDYNYPNKMKYNIRMQTTSGLSCISDTIIQVNLIPHPRVGYILPEVCLADSYAEFLDSTKIDDNSTNKFIYKWDFNVSPPAGKKLPTILPAAITAKNPRVKYNDFADYVVSLRVTQSETGCVDSLASKFTVNGAIPNASFRVIRDTALCTNDSVRIENLSTVDFGTIGKLVIYWDINKLTDTTMDEFPYIGKKYAHKYTGYQYPNKMNYTIRMLASSGGVCADDTSNAITLVPSPVVGFTLPNGCLQNGIANFTDTTKIANNSNNFKYLWNFGDVANALNNTDVNKNTSHIYTSAKNYNVKLVVTSLKGCIDSTTSVFTVNGAIPKTVFNVIKDTALCSNEFVKISDSTWTNFGIIDTLKLNWGDGSPDTIINRPTINTLYQHYYANFSVPNKLDYTIQLSSVSGLVCKSNTSTAIKIVPPPNVPVITSPKNFLCLYDSLNLSSNTTGGVPPFNYLWTTTNTNSKMTDSTIHGLLVGNTGVSLQLTDRKKCVYGFDNIFQIPVIGIPTATIAAVDTVICNGDSVVITGQGANTYKWYRNDTLFLTNQVGRISVGTPGAYKLVVNDGSCNSLKSGLLTISLLVIPRYTFTTKTDGCIGVPLIINTSAVEQNKIHFKWTFGDGTTSYVANPGYHKYMSNGFYKINLDVSNDWCPKYAYQVNGPAVKVVAPLYGNSYTLYLYPNLDTVLMSKSDPGYTQYKWTPGTFLSNPNIARPVFKGDKSTLYTLVRTDTVTSCNIYDEYDINVSADIYLNVPNAFTPNNDGLNDILKIEYGAGITSFSTFKIFNRWGKLVFQTNEISKGWDGRDANGVLQEMDAYTYLVEYSYNDFFKNVVVPVKKTGSIILFR